jgi:NAD(P)H-nitrite reductase large subunit
LAHPSVNSQPPLIIIGNGIAGITLAREVRKRSNQPIIVISAESEYFFSRTALMYVYMGHMKFEHLYPYEKDFWINNRIELVKAYVQKINVASKTIWLDDGSIRNYDKLVIATGSLPNKINCTGEELGGVMGMYSKQDLENLERCTPGCKHAVIIGGGLIGIEMAEMLHSRNIGVSFLVRENGFWASVLPPAESEMINRHLREHSIDLRLSTTVTQIVPGADGMVGGVITNEGEKIECQVVGLTAGVSPNIRFLAGSGIETRRGVLVNAHFETNCKDIYAIGDCAEQAEAIGLRKPVEAVWYTGKIMGETLAKTLCGVPTVYKPGHWFNSAKFFDIEYQAYGWVFATPRPEESQFYWEHPGGKKAIRVSWHKKTREFLGIHSLGIRLRQDFFNQALDGHHTVDTVINNLRQANFDPEFSDHHHQQIRLAFEKHIHPQFESL